MNIKALILSLFFYGYTASVFAAADHNFAGFNDGLTAPQLQGMNIEVVFADNTSNVGIWNGSNVIGTGWNLAYTEGTPNNSTIDGIWNFTTTAGLAVKSVNFSLVESNGVFDIGSNGQFTRNSAFPSGDTAGSLNGSFGNSGGPFGTDFEWLFSQSGGLNGADPLGDIFLNLLINDFNGSDGLLAANGGTFSFTADVDTGIPVPVPATIYLLATGLFALQGFGRRKLSV